jgi:hypothetical protein
MAIRYRSGFDMAEISRPAAARATQAAEWSVILARKAARGPAHRLLYQAVRAAEKGGLPNRTTSVAWRRTMFLTTTRRPFESFQTLRRLNNVLDEAFGTPA